MLEEAVQHFRNDYISAAQKQGLPLLPAQTTQGCCSRQRLPTLMKEFTAGYVRCGGDNVSKGRAYCGRMPDTEWTTSARVRKKASGHAM